MRAEEVDEEESAPSRVDDLLDEEVRVALALNGGVSLAVWMGGCAVELDCGRRAHLGAEEGREDGGRSVYSGLCKGLGRVLVLDIMSGASAGGINGGLLAAAIRHAHWLPSDFIRTSWLDMGDASTLLQRISEPNPRALMQGNKFHRDLHSAFEQIVGPDGGSEERGRDGGAGLSGSCCENAHAGGPTDLPKNHRSLSELDVKLVVTTTNLIGEPRVFRDFWGQKLGAREYRGRFRFENRADYTAETLAVASRASASFPFAFEPWHVQGATGELADFPQGRWVVDGGLLDNAPIADALALIPSRPADRQVQRFLCYVNAEPVEAPDPSPPEGEPEPSLTQMLDSVVNLPRKAPFVDQLTAIEWATRGSVFSGEPPEFALLKAELPAMRVLAHSLLGSYRNRRLRLSIEELVDQAGDVQAFVKSLPEGAELPWLPVDLEPERGERWQWGISPVQRTIHLVVDLFTRSMAEQGLATRLPLIAARQDVDGPLVAVEGVMSRLAKASPADGSPAATIQRAAGEMRLVDPIPLLRTVASAACGVAELLGPGFAEGLFGEGWLEASRSVAAGAVLPQWSFNHFLRRMLAIEVLRRALETGEQVRPTQELRFAQITPYAPSLIFTATPWRCDGWATPEDKLLGLGLGHFAGFYRRSWRANDFLWGRLDAAARVVDLLVSPERAVQLACDGAKPGPWETLADSLMNAQPAAAQRWLLEEVLSATPGGGATVEGAEGESEARLRGRLIEALKANLVGTDSKTPGSLTRILFTRAAQAEILHEEIRHLNLESSADEGLGAGSKALKLSEDLKCAIQELRCGPSLPRRLTGEDEAVSDLAVQTGTQAGLVGLAMLRTAGVPLKRVLFLLRVPLLQASGTVARQALYRAAVAIGFWSLVLFLAGRLLTIDESGAPTIGLLGSTAEAMTVVALVGVVGLIVLPTLRAWRTKSWTRRVGEGAWALSLLASGVLAGVLLTHFAGGRSWEVLLTAPGADPPPPEVLAIPLALALGMPLAGFLTAGRGFADALLRSRYGGAFAAIGVIAVAVALAVFTINPVASALNSSEWWQVTVAALALFAAPVCSTAYLFTRR